MTIADYSAPDIYIYIYIERERERERERELQIYFKRIKDSDRRVERESERESYKIILNE